MWDRTSLQVAATGLLGITIASSGCGGAPVSPTPTPMAPAAELPPPAASTPLAGLSLQAVSPSAGPLVGGDYIQLEGHGFQAGLTVMLDGIPIEIVRVSPTSVSARTRPHTAGPVDVVIKNPDGQVAIRQAGYTFATFSVNAIPGVVSPGEQLTVSWVAPSGRNCSGGGDWIAIYRVGDPDQTGAVNGHSDLWFDHLCGVTTGTRTLTAPGEPGVYEFRYMVDAFSVARSAPVEVRAP